MRNTVNFKWKSVEGVSGYHLYRNGELILTTQDFSYLDDSLEYDKDFQYDIASFDKGGDDGPLVSVKVRTH